MAENSPKRLVVDARWVGPRPTGVGNSILRQLEGLERLPSVSGPSPAWQVFAIRGAESLQTEETRAVWSRLSHTHLLDVAMPPQDHPRADWWLVSGLPNMLRVLRADVLYSPAYIAPPFTGTTRRVVMVHDDLIWSEPTSYPLGFRNYLGVATRLAVARAHRVIFPSADARDRVARRLGIPKSKLGIVPHGIDPEVIAPHQKTTREPVAVYVASAEDRKNHEVLLRAIEYLPPDLQLRFVGFRPEAARARRLDAAYPARWMSIPEAGSGDVARELGRAALMVHPSRGEGFGLPLIEAMASATPMILSDIPVLREVAGDAALYVNPNDPRAWGEAITRLAGNESLRAHLVAAARIRLQRFTLESCGQALLATCAAACAD